MGLRKCKGWLETYLDYTADQEPTDKLNFWVGATVLSAAVKRQIWMKRVRYVIYPNIYVFLIADSGEARKSQAMNVGMKLLQAADPDIFYVSGSMTPEGLIKHMNRQKNIVYKDETGGKIQQRVDSHVIIHMDEIAESFGYDRTRASRFTILLTKIYNAGDDQTHTIASEEQVRLKNLYPVVLGGSDPANLKVLPEDAIAGLVGRSIFVTESKIKRPISWESPEESEKADKLYPLLREDLFKISQLRGEMKPTDEGREYFDEWYRELCAREITDPRTRRFRSRCHDTALKISMLLALSERDDLVVEQRHIKKGIEWIEQQMPEFANLQAWAATSVYAQNRARFIDFLRRQGGAGLRRQLMRYMSISLEEIIVLEQSLEQEHTLEVKVAGREVFYKLSDAELKKKA